MVELVAEKSHAVLGPSGWGTWSICPGSVPLSEGIIDKGSSYAKEGTAAHSLLETCLIEGFDAEDLLGRKYEVEGETFTVDMEMADAVNSALAFIKTEIDVDAGDILMPEQQVPIGHLTGETGAEGTSDIVGVTKGGTRLVIGDYKHGKGVMVWASEKVFVCNDDRGETYELKPNGQLAMYALGTLEKFGLVYDEIETVLLMVLQPRLDHFDLFEMTVDELIAFGQEVTLAAGCVELEKQRAAVGDELLLVPGDKQCKFCKAKHICPALKQMVSTTLQQVSTISDPAEFENLTLPKQASSTVIDADSAAEQLMSVYRAASLIEELLKSVRAEVERRLFAGDKLPGVKLVEGKKGNRAWRDADEAAVMLTKPGRLKASEAYKKTPISPTEAEKKLKERPSVWAKLAPLITQSPGKPSVALESDPRPELQLGASLDDFEDLALTDQTVDGLMDIGGDAPAPTVDDLMA